MDYRPDPRKQDSVDRIESLQFENAALKEQLADARDKRDAACNLVEATRSIYESENAELRSKITDLQEEIKGLCRIYELEKKESECLRKRVEELESLPKPEDILRIRCLDHRNVPQLNTKESSGAECGACIAQDFISGVALSNALGNIEPDITAYALSIKVKNLERRLTILLTCLERIKSM